RVEGGDSGIVIVDCALLVFLRNRQAGLRWPELGIGCGAGASSSEVIANQAIKNSKPERGRRLRAGERAEEKGKREAPWGFADSGASCFEDRGSRIEDRGLRIEDRGLRKTSAVEKIASFLRSSILDLPPTGTIVLDELYFPNGRHAGG